MEAYHYMECGLDNVMIEGMVPCKDDEGDDVCTIPNVLGLHKVIAESIVERGSGMTGAELRFIRTEMGMTQAELAKVVHHDPQSIGRWERNEFAIDQTAEALIRLLAIEQLELKIDGETVSQLSEKCVPSAASKQIVIDGRDPTHYKQAA
ncbi:helix-turn-helix transcriptional regulator [Bradyrhizobium sp. 168]|uniref:helix-turn-helix domain-containing protein n=1 Tax=Bradyrhizobium sp. 168 TaxID=2782639 RepID=UPI001FFA0DCA|nr:helix-turn-helix transcriptional regulator [Bradyrhizobium sp. 168]MCK1578576.1 helix-turn-helix transcriptional regulator [Bradyrhizobium sp. 168]